MAGWGIVVSFVLDSVHGDPVRYWLCQDTSFDAIFWSYMDRSGDNSHLVQFFFMNSVVKWDLTPGDISLASADVVYASTIYVLWFGWLFLVSELKYCDNRWEDPHQ